MNNTTNTINTNNLILASRSPRRRELMQSAGFAFTAVPAEGEEHIAPGTPPEQAAESLAEQKAAEILAKHPDSTVIGADTIVAINGELLGKPADAREAAEMLRKLSGKRHSVYTGVAVLAEETRIVFSEKTDVEFYPLTDDEIAAYIATGEPFDKAGAYGIQERGMLLVREIRGDFYNVMGLPIARLSRVLRSGGDRSFTKTDKREQNSSNIGELLGIMARLRQDCPWDREQTHESIRVNVIEEAYEVAEAIDSGDPALLREELGDLLLQVVFHAQMASERGNFDFADVCAGICRKLIYRHPHVFGETAVNSTEQVLQNWEELKSKAKGESTAADRLESVPRTLPALMRGEKVGKRAAQTGFDFADVSEALECLKNEVRELELAITDKKEDEIESEFGDILFSCCNLGRFLKKDCEKALTICINRFIMRFRELERAVTESGKSISEMTPGELDSQWQKAKKSVG